MTKLKKLLFEAPEASVFNIETHLIRVSNSVLPRIKVKLSLLIQKTISFLSLQDIGFDSLSHCIEPAKVVTFFALVSGISCAPLGKAFLLMSDFVDPGLNSTSSSNLDFLSPMWYLRP